MHALVSLLPSPFSETVADLWRELEQEHGLQGIRVTPYPQFSWRIAQDYDLESLKSALSLLVTTIAPFPIRTTGLGVFTGPLPAIYIPLVKSNLLSTLHHKVLEATDPTGRGLNPLYDPSAWVPHISLAHTDLDPSNVAGVVKSLALRSFNWEMTIDNLAFIHELAGENGKLKYQIPLTTK